MLKKTFSALTVMAALGATALLPATASAQDRDHDRRQEHRLFDRTHRDYHRWNRGEDRRYRAYLAARHQRYLAFQRASRQRQIAYWRWRHLHDRRW